MGPGGRVVATDLETEALERIDAPNLEVRRHDLLADPLPEGEFDLVHARFLLVHLPRRDEALDRIIEATRPGGWVVLGDADFHGMSPARPDEVFERVWAALLAAFDDAGVDNGYGSRIPGLLDDRGLESVEAEKAHRYTHGGGIAGDLYAPTVERVRPQMLAAGAVTEAEVDRAIAMLRDPGFAHWTSIHVTASGRRLAQPPRA